MAASLAQLCCGVSAEDRARLRLGAPSDYHYLNMSDCYTLSDVKDEDEVRSLPLYLYLKYMAGGLSAVLGHLDA